MKYFIGWSLSKQFLKRKVLYTHSFCIFKNVDVTQTSLIQKCKVLMLVSIHAKFQDSTTFQSKVSLFKVLKRVSDVSFDGI